MDDESFNVEQITQELQALTGMIVKTSGRAMHERLMRSGLSITPIQFGALRVLALQPHTLSEMSKMFVVDPSTLVPVVDGLEARGLVERRKDPQDRRRTPIVLTKAGEEVLASVMKLDHDHVLLTAVESLGMERALKLRDLLRQLLQALPEGEEALCNMEDLTRRLRATRPATEQSDPA